MGQTLQHASYDGLDPVDSAGREEHEVAGALHEAVDGHLEARELVEVGPPGAGQEVHAVPACTDGSRIEHIDTIYCISHLLRALCCLLEHWSLIDHVGSSIASGILIAESVEHAPIWLRHAVPLAFAGAHVDIDRTRVVVLLMTGCAAARHFYIQLNAVHSYRDINILCIPLYLYKCCLDHTAFSRVLDNSLSHYAILNGPPKSTM